MVPAFPWGTAGFLGSNLPELPVAGKRKFGGLSSLLTKTGFSRTTFRKTARGEFW